MVSVFTWRLKGEPTQRFQAPGAMPREGADIEIYCPEHRGWYAPDHPSKAEAPEGSTSREQWITGLCSDVCWNAYLGASEPASDQPRGGGA